MYICAGEDVPLADYELPLSKVGWVNASINASAGHFSMWMGIRNVETNKQIIVAFNVTCMSFFPPHDISGSDVTVVGYGAQLQILHQLCDMAHRELGVSCELIDLRTILTWTWELYILLLGDIITLCLAWCVCGCVFTRGCTWGVFVRLVKCVQSCIYILHFHIHRFVASPLA